MSSRIKKTVDLLAKASGTVPIFNKKGTRPPAKFEVLLQLQDGSGTTVQRILSKSVHVSQVILDDESGIEAKVLTVIRIP